MNITPTTKESEFIAAYFEAIDFTDTPRDHELPELDEDFARESVIDCLAFFSSICCYLSDDQIAQAGHDFWLTRNGHGVGFWDRPEIYGKAYSEMFTTRAQGYGEVTAYYEEQV